MSKKVSKAFLVGEKSFRAGGDVINVPAGKHNVDDLLAKFPKEDRVPIALLAQSQGVTLEYEITHVEEAALTPADSPSFADVAATLPAEPEEQPGEPSPEDPAPRTRRTVRKK